MPYLRLIRPADSAVVTLGTLAGWQLADPQLASAWIVVLLTVSNTLLFAASIAINDWHDAGEDSINQPRRPVPAGDLSRPQALATAVVLFVLGVVSALAAGVDFGLFALLISAASVVYTLHLKATPLVGNLTVALISTYPLACWLLITERPPLTYWVLTVSCFVFRLGAEILKTAQDFAGDRSVGVQTVATVRGVDFANRLGSSTLCAAVLLCWTLVPRVPWPFTVGLSLSTGLVALAWLIAFSFVRAGSADGVLITIERVIMSVMVLGYGIAGGVS